MKLLLTVALFFVLQSGAATIFYISPAGSDINGNGSINNPWHSLFKATSAVTVPGSIIHIMAGNYTETSRSILAPGVSIEGEGISSVIQSSLTEEFVAIIIATSPEGTDGNQHISNIKLDGNNRITSWGIEVRGRKNFSIYNCVIVDFEDRGVLWGGRNDNEEAPPGIYATGNSFYNNILKNCAKYTDYGRGCLNIGGQEGMLIYNNTIQQTGRAKGTNGWPIKYYNGGFLKGCKIYGNTIIKEAYDGTSWDFAIELFNEFGLEIYKNTVVGAIDLNHQNKDNYLYSVYIHDNVIGPENIQSKMETGITLEYETNSAIIENNHLKNLGTPIYFNPREGNLISNVIIKNNLCDNIGVSDGSHHGFAVNFVSGGQNFSIADFIIDHNKFSANTSAEPYYGIGIVGAEYANNIKIQNNTIENFSIAAITANPASLIDTFLIQGNILTGNGNNNNPFYIRGIPINYTIEGNTKNRSKKQSHSNFNFKQQIIRPLYYEIRNTSLLEFLGILTGIFGFLFLTKENAYVFPLWLINSGAFIFVNFEEGVYFKAFLNLIFILGCFYGWKIWLKRNKKKHRIVRIKEVTKNEILLQLALFLLIFICLSLSFYYLKKYLPYSTDLWESAITNAAAITGFWLVIRKKTTTWYWWIGTSIGLLIYNYLENNLLMSCYHLGVLVVCLLGIFEWKKRKIIIK